MESKKKDTAILLMHCPDQPGIIAVITEFVNANGGNIVYLDQYVDKFNGIFYMRVEWDLENFIIPREKLSEYFQILYGQRYQLTYKLSFSNKRQRMAIFVKIGRAHV